MATSTILLKTILTILTVLLLKPVCRADFILYSGQTLHTGDSLKQCKYVLIMQEDCNLVLYDSGSPVWASNTGGRASGRRSIMQSDGNLVVYDSNDSPIWATNTGSSGQSYYVFILQEDRNLVIYGRPVWASASNAPGSFMPAVEAVSRQGNTNGTLPTEAAAPMEA